MENRITPDKIFISPNTGLNMNHKEVFVFGSNESGLHGSGAAHFAYTQLGFPWKLGFGPSKDLVSKPAFAIPTKDWTIRTLPLDIIAVYVSRFIAYAKHHNDYTYLVTEIGCGLAGYHPKDIAPFFKEAVNIHNIHLPKRFWDELL